MRERTTHEDRDLMGSVGEKGSGVEEGEIKVNRDEGRGEGGEGRV